MRYIFTLISIALAHMVFFGFVYAENTTDITKPTYKIELSNLDPFTHNDASGNAGTGTV